jgi:hypothetical protein
MERSDHPRVVVTGAPRPQRAARPNPSRPGRPLPARRPDRSDAAGLAVDAWGPAPDRGADARPGQPLPCCEPQGSDAGAGPRPAGRRRGRYRRAGVAAHRSTPVASRSGRPGSCSTSRSCSADAGSSAADLGDGGHQVEVVVQLPVESVLDANDPVDRVDQADEQRDQAALTDRPLEGDHPVTYVDREPGGVHSRLSRITSLTTSKRTSSSERRNTLSRSARLTIPTNPPCSSTTGSRLTHRALPPRPHRHCNRRPCFGPGTTGPPPASRSARPLSPVDVSFVRRGGVGRAPRRLDRRGRTSPAGARW